VATSPAPQFAPIPTGFEVERAEADAAAEGDQAQRLEVTSGAALEEERRRLGAQRRPPPRRRCRRAPPRPSPSPASFVLPLFRPTRIRELAPEQQRGAPGTPQGLSDRDLDQAILATGDEARLKVLSAESDRRSQGPGRLRCAPCQRPRCKASRPRQGPGRRASASTATRAPASSGRRRRSRRWSRPTAVSPCSARPPLVTPPSASSEPRTSWSGASRRAKTWASSSTRARCSAASSRPVKHLAPGDHRDRARRLPARGPGHLVGPRRRGLLPGPRLRGGRGGPAHRPHRPRLRHQDVARQGRHPGRGHLAGRASASRSRAWPRPARSAGLRPTTPRGAGASPVSRCPPPLEDPAGFVEAEARRRRAEHRQRPDVGRRVRGQPRDPKAFTRGCGATRTQPSGLAAWQSWPSRPGRGRSPAAPWAA
jgi:hypothetical protein